jgi:ferrochelatase
MGGFRKAVVLVNLGSPRSPRVPDVRVYLKEFLIDPSVIDLPAWFRHILVKGIITPIRAPRSAKLYEMLNTEQGFPLIYHSINLENKVREQLPSDMDLFLAMRYGEPSLRKLLQQMKNAGYDEILIFPLYPQFASSTTGSVIKLVSKELKDSSLIERVKIVSQFHPDPGFTELWQKKISDFNPENYDAIVFSYHGIPVRQTRIAHPGQSCEKLMCEQDYTGLNKYCYFAACHQTTKSISNGLNMGNDRIFTSFQSRFGRNWLEPFTDRVLLGLVGEGKRKILIVSPSFVADCLETIIEIGHEYKQLFKKAGGEILTLVPSLNSDAEWASLIARMATGSYHDFINFQNRWDTQDSQANKEEIIPKQAPPNL